MQLDYYYTRLNNLKIRTAGKATDNLASGIILPDESSLLGGREVYYGESISLKATLSAGYIFKGWYDAKDVLEGYMEDSTKELSTYSIKSDISLATPVSIDTTYSFQATDNRDIIAVTEPLKVADASVSISGKNNYSYGYVSSLENEPLKATVTITGDSEEVNATYVVGYQWYEGENAIPGAISSTYLFPTGKSKGTYSYKCKVTVARKDNERTVYVSPEYPVTVSPANMEITVSNYQGTYDGLEHGITISVKKPLSTEPYTIYYGTEELTADNYTTKGRTENIIYKDAKTDNEGNVSSYPVYYYITNEDGNYLDCAGSATVTIEPITLSVRAGVAFSKVYDGTTDISGSITEEGTDKYKLARGNGTNFVITGLLTADKDTSLLDFDAAFNDKHVDTAGTITLQDMKIVDASGNINKNYKFATGAELNISGNIVPLPLKTKWSITNSFIYDGASHVREVSLEEGQTIPDSGIALTTQGEQTNAGTYNAYAAIVANEAYKTSDYTFTNASGSFTITERPLTITPVENTKAYNGKIQKLDAFTLTETNTGVGLVSGHTYTASTTGARNVGTHEITAASMLIKDATEKNVTDNYNITYGKANLTITPITITVSGIIAKNKQYDKGMMATLDVSKVTFTGMIAGDKLQLDPSKVNGEFENADIGQEKTVKIKISSDALTGADAGNYILNIDDSQKNATANITERELTLRADNKTMTYRVGTLPSYTGTYSGLLDEDELKNVVTGTPTYTCLATLTSDPGKYDITPEITGLTIKDNHYKLKTEEGILTIAKKEIGISGITVSSKVYDGTTDVLASQINTNNVTYTGIESADDSYKGIKSVTGIYREKDVKNGITIDLEVTLNDYLAARYTLKSDSQTTAMADITKNQLIVTAKDKEIAYGSDIPAYEVTYLGFQNNETEGVLDGHYPLIVITW